MTFGYRFATLLRRIVLLLAFAGAAQAGPSDVVISQLYGGGGNAGATLKNDFVELLNRSSVPQSLNGLSVQYTSATGTGNFGANSGLIVVLPNVVLQPGQYFLVQLAVGTGGTQNLPAPDATGSIAMSATAGKVALVNSAAGLGCNGGSNPCTPAQAALIFDLVGYGGSGSGGANFFEGSGAAPLTANATADLRLANGCTDTNNNNADFAAGTPNPRNTASSLNLCGAPANLPIVATCPALGVTAGSPGSVNLTATDADSVVNGVSITSAAVPGIALGTPAFGTGDGDTASVPLNVAATVGAGNYAVQVTFTNNEAQNAACTVNVAVSGITTIPAIQGAGPASPMAGQTVTTQGVVTKVVPTNYGYFIQDETGDGDPATSDGIFVFSPSGIPAAVAVGNLVRVTGTVAEFQTLTELTSPTNVTLQSSGHTISPVTITLPETTEGELERYEGMLVQITTPLTVSQNFFQGRYGELTLSAGGRMEKATNKFRPGTPEALTLTDENARRRITLDDGSNDQNPNPIPYIGADNTLRAGDVVHGLTGVLFFGAVSTSLNDYKLHPTQAPVITRDNPRTASPDAVGGNVKVASFNVLNYFTTFVNGTTAFGQSGQGCAPSNTTADCRGADNLNEFSRQRAKIVSALSQIKADVVGLMEIQNNGNTAAQNLVDGLNAVLGAGTYAATALPPTTGTDAIRVAMIYRPATLTPVGVPLSDPDAVHNRPPLAQTFAAANGEKFSVVVNHFKSKGCDGAAGADLDQGDGQGCFNARRVLQAERLITFIDSVATAAGDGDVIVIGDLNAYGKEDPVVVLTDGGHVDQVVRFHAFEYSYVFDGESGYLDHALASATLSPQVTGAVHWHINADEPSVIDYNTEFKPQDLYAANAYRSSDHDPVVIGLNLVKAVNGSDGRDTLTGTPGDDVITGGPGADTLTGGAGRDVFVYRSIRDGTDTITDFTPGIDRIDLAQLLASVGYTGSNAVADGYVRVIDVAGGASLQIDADGAAGAGVFRPLATLRGVTAAQIDPARDLGL